MLTGILIGVPAAAFLAWVAPDLGSELSWAIVAVSAVLTVLPFVMLSLCSLRDPGFLPRSDIDPELGT